MSVTGGALPDDDGNDERTKEHKIQRSAAKDR
jgi:hypothetical protein